MIIQRKIPALRWVVGSLLCLLTLAVCAESIGARLKELVSPGDGGLAGYDILHPDQAFQLSATPLGVDTVRFTWVVEEGYYLYRDKFSITSLTDALKVNNASLQVPRGKVKDDESFGEVEVNTGLVSVEAPLLGTGAGGFEVLFQVGYQGCKEGSVCYPPQQKQLRVNLAQTGAALPPVSQGQLSVQDRITARLKQGSFMLNVLAFLSFGILLSLTPCVFPMIPILSGIIVGQPGAVSTARGLLLSLAYVLAMALTYALLGVLAGSLQVNLQAASQNIWTIGAFSLIFVLLALSMFGLYELRVPAFVQTRLSALSAPRDGSSGSGLYSSALMGAVSAIIVGPCVAPPLAGALLYISQTGDAVLGGAALFAMGLGFGAPLLIIGASAGSLLPRVGAWMEKVKQGFGVIMLGVAIWLLERVLPGSVTMILWGLLVLLSALLLGALEPVAKTGRVFKVAGIAGLVYAGALLVGALSGSDDKLRPLAHLAGQPHAASSLDFQRIKSVADLERKLTEVAAQDKFVMLDFYADWCVTCIEMEKHTFAAQEVQQALAGVVLLQADVTRNDAEDRQLLEKFQLFGPPAILFFNTERRELQQYRLIGYVKPEQFLRHLARLRAT